jgi:hypothetical protein
VTNVQACGAAGAGEEERAPPRRPTRPKAEQRHVHRNSVQGVQGAKPPAVILIDPCDPCGRSIL